MEVEDNGHLPFLDILLSRWDDGSICCQFFRKKTRMEQYLHANSHHLPTQKFRVLNTLATRTLRIFDDDHLDQEKAHRLEVFESNGYSRPLGLKAFHKSNKEPMVKPALPNPIPKVYPPYIQGTLLDWLRTLLT